jgi:protein involved in polysaccharide export with SLBB domain
LLRLQAISRSVRSFARRGAAATAFTGLVLAAGGCLDKGFLDQTEMGAFNKEPMVVPIVDRLTTTIEEEGGMFANAEPPVASDLVPPEGDYAISPGDLLAVTITDLVAQGVETLQQRRVTDSGNISLPYVGTLRIAGLTEAQAEEAVRSAYRDAQIIQNAQVSVITIEPRGRTYTLGGATGRSGQFPIFKNDLRLIEALANAADFEVTRGTRGYKELFIIRDRDASATTPAPTDGATEPPADVLRPRSDRPLGDGDLRRATYLRAQPADPAAPTAVEAQPPATQPTETGEGRYIIIDGKPVLVGGGQPTTEPSEPDVQPAMPLTPAPAVTETPDAPDTGMAGPAATEPFEFDAPQEPGDVRVIRIPVEQLVRGELKYNVVIRPGDVIWVPAPLEGVYYMGGHVQRVGVYGLGNGNDVTLTNAIIAAGGLDQLAVPWRTQIIRRVGDKNVFATVDLTKIFNGQEPDLYLKKDDQVIVGTQFWATFAAALRNGFRLTYGFGFLYDRNYYDENEFN